MSISTIQITAKGRALLARAQTGTTINFTHIKMGDGTLSGQIIDDMTDVISQKSILDINGFKVLLGGKAKVQATFNNQGLSTGFYWREIAVFAMDPDNPAAEIMYCYGNAGALADYIPAQGSQILEKVISVLTCISNAANVTATIDSSNVFLTSQDADDIYIKKSLATAASQFLVSSGVGQFVAKTVSEIKSLLGLGTAADKDFNVSGGVASYDTVNAHLADYTMQIPWGGTTTNIGNAYSLANPVISTLVPGMAVSFKCNADSTGAVSFNWNGKGAKSVLKANSSAVTNWKNGGVYTVRYDGVNFQLQGEGGDYGTAAQNDVKVGITFGTETGVQIGTYTSDATATAADITSGMIAYANGQRIIGTSTKKNWAINTGVTNSTPLTPTTITGLGFTPTFIFVQATEPTEIGYREQFIYSANNDLYQRHTTTLTNSLYAFGNNVDIDQGITYNDTRKITVGPGTFSFNSYLPSCTFKYWAFG